MDLISADIKFEQYEPKSYQDAIQCEEANLWRLAIEDEYFSLMKNNTWILTNLPPGRKTIKSKLVFKVKPGHVDVPPRYKARLVAKGYTQRQWTDYEHTFAPVVKHDSLRIILSIAAVRSLEMIQLDIQTAFLYGVLDVELYLEQHKGFVVAGRETELCLLKKCIYGLKQTSRVCNVKFDEFLVKFGLTQSVLDPWVYFHRKGKEHTVMCIYVDDGLICSSSKIILSNKIEHLGSQFDIRSSPVDRFGGLNITRDQDSESILVSQADFIQTMLNRINMSNCHQKSVPADPNTRLSVSISPVNRCQREKMEPAPFWEAVGCLIYVSIMTRPNFSFAVGQAARFCSKPGPAHWEAVKR